MKPTVKCKHPSRHRIEGPRVPLRWGAAATQMCTKCGGWRLRFGIANTRFRPAATFAAAYGLSEGA